MGNTNTLYEVKSMIALIYNKASFASAIVGSLPKGAQVEVLRFTNQWVCFIFNGNEAYIRKSSIKISTAIPTKTGSITIKYLNVDSNNEILNSDTYNNLQLGTYTYTAKNITNYTTNLPTSMSVTLDENNTNQTIIFYYSQIIGNITIKYLDFDTNNEISASDFYDNLTLKTYTYKAKDVSNYKVNSPASQSITLDENNTSQNITFYYSQILGDVTVKYLDFNNNTEILTSDIYNNLQLGTYTYEAKSINGYTINSSTSQTVTLAENNYSQTITFLYEKILGKVTIQYIDTDTNENLLDTEIYEKLELGNYSYKAKTIDNYSLSSEDTINVTLTENNLDVSILFKYKLSENNNAYTIDLSIFNIKNDGTNPVETSNGINKALQYAYKNGFTKIIFPKGTYLIDETNPIIINFKNITIDLSGSIFQINTNRLPSYSIMEMIDGSENTRITNGILKGDKDTHDYTTISSTHEWGCGLIFKGGKNCEVDNLTITNVPGYGISTETGINSNIHYYLSVNDIESGNIDSYGINTDNINTTRTKIYYDLDKCNGEYEIGYTLGYMGYKYLYNKEFTAYYYDINKNFISKQDCIQFKKYSIPTGVKYARFVYPQSSITKGDLDFNNAYAFLSNAKPPRNINLHDCTISQNRSLGIAFTGGIDWIIENNTFDSNGGNAPNYAIDFEDGWELMQDILVKGNKFINNNSDVVICAGNNIAFENNQFQKWVYFYPRATNYKFINNIVDGGIVTFQVKLSSCEVSGNTYKNNSTINAASASNLEYSYNLINETIINSSTNISSGNKLLNSYISNSTKGFRLSGSLENCTIETPGKLEAINLVLDNCTILNSSINLHYSSSIQNCKVENSFFETYGNTSTIYFKNSTINNSQLIYNTWGSACDIIVDSCIVTTDSELSFIRMSAGKTKLLKIINNQIKNFSTKSLIYMYDTSYSIPNGNIILNNNNITQPNSAYIFNGIAIKSGIINFSTLNDTIINSSLLNPIYINNPYFNII